MRPSQSSIKGKVMLAIMLASITVLLVTVAAFMVYDIVTFRQAMQRNLETQARMIADNSTASVLYGIEKDAHEVLNSLRAEPHITAAALYDLQGKLFVKYPAQISDASLPARPQDHKPQFANSHLDVFQPVVQSGQRMGTLYLRSDLTALSQRSRLYGVISLLIIIGSMLVAFWLSATLQRRISNPIIALAETARAISVKQDFSVRAKKTSEDELGDLTEAFNTMLNQIQGTHSELEKSRAHLQLVTDYAAVLLCHVDRNQVFHFVNPAYASRFNLTPPMVVGRQVREVVGETAYQSFSHYMERVMAGQRVEFEKEIPYEELGPRWMHCIYMPERNARDEVIGFVGVINDITERKQDEQQLERARDEALAASRAKDDFLAALSHELRTPLNPVLLLASSSAEDDQLPPEIREQFVTIRNNVELEARLIDDLLDLTKITRGKLSLEMLPQDVHAVLRRAIGIVQDEADKKRIFLILDFKAEHPVIAGDSVRLQQIFWNVLKNAVKFTPEGGRIIIQTRTAPDTGNVSVNIIDTGIGLTPAEIGSIFNAFAQGDHAAATGSHRFGGLGLGLTISRMLVDLHFGTIEASSPGRGLGATFTIEFPCKKLDAGNNARPNLIAEAAKVSAPPKKGRRILLVEDHEPTRIALAHLLTRREYKVMSATTVAGALALAQQEKFDLVVSDIGLPDGDGYMLMAELRDTFGLKGIALSGYGMEQDVARGQRAGFVAHLIKPVRVESLEKTLNDVS